MRVTATVRLLDASAVDAPGGRRASVSRQLATSSHAHGQPAVVRGVDGAHAGAHAVHVRAVTHASRRHTVRVHAHTSHPGAGKHVGAEARVLRRARVHGHTAHGVHGVGGRHGRTHGVDGGGGAHGPGHRVRVQLLRR